MKKGIKKASPGQKNCIQQQMPLLPGLLPEGLKSCAFSGHRELPENFDGQELEKMIETLVGAGVTTFFFGGAVGFDLLAANCILRFKEKFPEIVLVACIPCDGQEKYYSAEEKEQYVRALAQSGEVVILSGHYYRGCMLRRNDYMAERADALIAFCRKNTGGTAYTVRAFRKRGKPVFFV